jgi:ligand-binding sensor domain-containing protein
MHKSLILPVIILSLLCPASSALYVDVPHAEAGILSAGINDITSGLYGDVIFATDSGMSFYDLNGTWYSVTPGQPRDTPYGALAPISGMVTAVEIGPDGRLWIGYANGLQIQNDTGFFAVQDQHLLKNLAINALTRWDDEIWIATGDAGLHRYRNGIWTWYKPFGPENLGCRTIRSMAVDAAGDSLVLGSERDGIWMLKNRSDSPRFEPVLYRNEPIEQMIGLRQDPFGGVYIFNQTTVLRYTQEGGVVHILDTTALSDYPSRICDLAATPGGLLLIASDRGIYGWNGTGMHLQVTAKDGIKSDYVKRLFVDASGRVWFVVPRYVGYISALDSFPPLDLFAAPGSAPAEAVTAAMVHEADPPLPARTESGTDRIPSIVPAPVHRFLAETASSLQAWIDDMTAWISGSESGFLDPGLQVGWGFTLEDLRTLLAGGGQDQ